MAHLRACKLKFVEDIIRRFCTEKSLHTHYNDLKIVTYAQTKNNNCHYFPASKKHCLIKQLRANKVFDLPNEKTKTK